MWINMLSIAKTEKQVKTGLLVIFAILSAPNDVYLIFMLKAA